MTREKNAEPAYAKSLGVASAERPTSNAQRKYRADGPVCEEALLLWQLAGLDLAWHPHMSRVGLGRQGFSPHEAKKCYN